MKFCVCDSCDLLPLLTVLLYAMYFQFIDDVCIFERWEDSVTAFCGVLNSGGVLWLPNEACLLSS